MSDSPVPARANLTPVAWGVLAFALGLALLSAAQLAYRFTLPTDGWAVLTTEDLDAPDWVYLENLVGMPSGLQRDDVVTAVNGQSVRGLASNAHVPPPPGWQAGQTVEMSVERQAHQLVLAVPVARWTPQAIGHYLLVRLELLVGLSAGLAFFALALFTFSQRSDVPAARALLLLSAAFLAINLSGLLPDGLSVQFDPVAFYASGVFGYLLFGLLLAPALLAFSLLFPRSKRLVQRHPWLALAPFGIGVLVGIAVVTGQAPVLGWLATQGMVAASILSLIHSGFTQRDAASWAQLRWAVGGVVIGLALMLLVLPAASGWIASPFLASLMGSGFHLGFAVMGAALAMAILRYRLYELDLIVNRALVYATLTACVVGIYVLIVAYLGWLFRAEGSLALSLVATGLVAVFFATLRTLVQRGVNRLMYGQRDEPYQVLTRLGQRLETAMEPSSALSVTVETVAQALKLPYVAIALQQGDSQQIVAADGAARNKLNRFPLTYAGQTIGELLVASRAPGEPLAPADQRLLRDLARQIGVTADTVLLTANLEQARLRLVTERGEARRQLGSDLHDGVGHQLVALTRQLERVMDVAADDPALARDLLTDANRRLVALTGQVRSLAHRLFPPELELLGLAGALRERAQADTGLKLHIDAPETLPSLPAEVEAAAYYITLEAITNVAKHADAQTCHIGIGLQPGPSALRPAVLELTIRDDGHGAPLPAARGLGLHSMQARAAELGGACRFESNPGGGTAILVRIPCPAPKE
jgi:signal transduction histidine kinase